MNGIENKFDIYISYSRSDQDFALGIAEILEKKGLRVWIDQWELVPGAHWEKDSLSGVEKSSTLAILVSPSLGEFQLAETRYGLTLNKKIYPILLPGSIIENIPPFLTEIEAIDLRDSFDSKSKLIRGIEMIVEPIASHRINQSLLPIGSRMPYTRNPTFTDRESELSALFEYFVSDHEENVSRATVITGMAGIGKTQLAIEFCYRYGHYFKGVHWLTANQDLQAEIAECGFAMGIHPWPETQEEQVRTTLAVWSEHGPHLVVLDNLEDLKILSDWRPRLGEARLLLTSRIGRWHARLGVDVKRLGALRREESKALLRKLAPRLGGIGDRELDTIAERFQDVPLGLHMAGSYLNTYPDMNVEAYLTRLEVRGSALKQEHLPDWAADDPTGYGKNLWAALEAGLEALEGDEDLGGAAKTIFLACGYLAPNVRIPREIFHGLLQDEEGEKETAPDLAVERLIQLGLLDPGEDGLLVHSMLTEYGRVVDSAKDASTLPGLADRLKWQSYRANQTGLPAEFVPLRAHVGAVAAWAENRWPVHAAPLWVNLGYHMKMMAEYQGARVAYERALAIDKEIYGTEHLNVATDLNNLGLVLQDLGDWDGARDVYTQALDIYKKTLPPEHPYVAVTTNNLGEVLRQMGDLPEAQKHFELALVIWKKNLGEDDIQVAIGNNNLGGVLREMNNLSEAQKHFKRALEIFKKYLGENHPHIATALNNLGMVLKDLGNLSEAQEHFEQALGIDELAYGLEHPDVARDLNNLGFVLQEQGNLGKALGQYKRALAIDEQFFASDHPRVVQRVINLLGVLAELGDKEAALALLDANPAVMEVIRNGRQKQEDKGEG